MASNGETFRLRSVELERLVAEGMTLLERRNAMEFCRDHAADLFEAHTGSSWRPRSESKVNHRALTAAMIDSRDFLAARRRAENEVLLPPGPKIAFAGGADCADSGDAARVERDNAARGNEMMSPTVTV